MNRKSWVSLYALLLCASCTREAPPAVSKADVLAEVGRCEIRVTDFLFEAEQRGGGIESIDRNALLEEMIASAALAAKARELGLDDDPEIRRIYQSLLAGKLRQLQLDPLLEQVSVTEGEVREYYESNPGRYVTPACRRLAILHIATDRTMTAERREEARQRILSARKEALAEANHDGFGVLAIRYSEDQSSRYRGGEIGWVEERLEGSRWDPAIVAAGAALSAPGDISPVIEGRDGLYLVKLMDTRLAAPVPFEQVSGPIRQRLLSGKRREVEQRFLKETRAALPVRTHDDVFQRLPSGISRTAAEPEPPSLR